MDYNKPDFFRNYHLVRHINAKVLIVKVEGVEGSGKDFYIVIDSPTKFFEKICVYKN